MAKGSTNTDLLTSQPANEDPVIQQIFGSTSQPTKQEGRKKLGPYEWHSILVSILGVLLVVAGGMGSLGAADDLALICWHCPSTTTLSESSPCHLFITGHTHWLTDRWQMLVWYFIVFIVISLLLLLRALSWSDGGLWVAGVCVCLSVLLIWLMTRCHHILMDATWSTWDILSRDCTQDCHCMTWMGIPCTNLSVVACMHTSVCVCLSASSPSISVSSTTMFPVMNCINIPSSFGCNLKSYN